MALNGYEQYQQNQLLTATPAQLLLAAYDGAIKFSRIAGEKMASNKLDEQSIYINKAIAIVCELMNTLKEDVSPQLVAQLRSLYIYMIEKLAHANLNQDQDALGEVIKILTELRQTWAEADRIIQQESQEAAA